MNLADLKVVCCYNQFVFHHQFDNANISKVSLEGVSSCFRVFGKQLLTFDGTNLVRSFGNDPEVEIGRSIQQLSGHCF
jgi:hypothetical protein